jgi:UDP-N-acetylmuramate--alanine ligase
MSGRAGPWSSRTLHFVGVGGAGMSAYARAAAALGARVSGSDRHSSPYSEQLLADGVLRPAIGEHDAANVPAGERVEVIYSSAVPAENPERAAARERGLPERPRAQLLGELSAMRRTLAVAGTHGKTTTASMLAHALRGAGLDPDWLVGGTVGQGEANARWSSDGEWLVLEADESDRSMLELDVEVGLLTNIELDHHASFGSLAELRGAFGDFLARARRAAVVWDRTELLELAPSDLELIPYDVRELTLTPGGSVFRWRGHEVRLQVPGEHNALNATAALEAARLAGADEALAVRSLASFGGAGRRFQLAGRSASGARVYDDYAHHPSEIAATLAGARTLDAERLIAVFQPHLYSRTRVLAGEHGAALAHGADAVVVLDVYPARERAEDHPGISGLLVAQAVADAAPGKPVYWLPALMDALPLLQGLLAERDVCVVMGAGDVDELARRLVAR